MIHFPKCKASWNVRDWRNSHLHDHSPLEKPKERRQSHIRLFTEMPAYSFPSLESRCLAVLRHLCRAAQVGSVHALQVGIFWWRWCEVRWSNLSGSFGDPLWPTSFFCMIWGLKDDWLFISPILGGMIDPIFWGFLFFWGNWLAGDLNQRWHLVNGVRITRKTTRKMPSNRHLCTCSKCSLPLSFAS